MKKVGHVVEPTAFATVVAEAPKRTWADDILDAQDIEDRLWKAYEERFAVNHDMALAYRYEPANDAQLAHVLKYFPPLVFSLRKGAQVEVNFEGILPHDGALIHWEHIKGVQYHESSFGDSLTVTLDEKGVLGAKTVKVKLGGLGKQKDDFNAAVGRYWHRHQVMRAQQ